MPNKRAAIRATKGRGKPRTSITLEKETMEFLVAEADREKRTVSSYIEKMLDDMRKAVRRGEAPTISSPEAERKFGRPGKQ